jgi:NADH-quinone oxidoreductase subunit C
MDNTELLNAALALDPEIVARENAGPAAIKVPAAKLVQIMRRLADEARFAFDMLMLHTAADWPAKQEIELFYRLHSSVNNQTLLVTTAISREEPAAPTLSSIWPIAEWQEREVYDMFGVRYQGHPDLRRILLEDEWQGHPLRKDYKDDFMLERPW